MKTIELRNVCKSFVKKRREGLLAKFLHTSPSHRVVIENCYFWVNKGEVVGITGSNGSGKSTLLRLIAGIYTPDSGDIIIRGKVIPLLNLKLGLQPKLSLKDNITFIATLFGVAKKNILYNNIISFSGLKEFTDMPLYQFSEGMKQRLVFSVAMFCNADILLLDEVFEVGDADFREKSKQALLDFVKKGGSVVLVSHDREILKYCGRVVGI